LKCEHSIEEYFYGTTTVGERGQIVIPAEARKVLNINPGDKLLVVKHPAGQALAIFKVGVMSEIFTAMAEDIKRLESEAANSDNSEEEPNGD